MVTQAKERIAGIYADGWSRIVATMIRLTGGDWDLAEECAQDAFAQALQKWPESGVPDEPLAWLTTTARHRAIDRMRRASTEAAKLREVAAMQPDPPPYARDSEIPDERLELMFTCCHPSLNLDAQVALTLRSLAGMSTAEIARAFLVPERTMGQRLFRAKQKVAHAGIPFRVPPAHLLPERLPAVLHVLYLLFNEGYGHPGETRLAQEAIRLARVLTALMPDEPEAHGMLALMLLHDARRPARIDARGNLVTLDEQDRSLWDAGADRRGHGDPGPGAAPPPGRAVPDPGGHRRVPCHRARRGPDRLAADRRVVRATRAGGAERDRGPEPGRRGRHGRRPRGRAAPGRRDRRDRAAGRLLPAARDAGRPAAARRAAAGGGRELPRGPSDLAPTEAERRFLRSRLSEL